MRDETGLEAEVTDGESMEQTAGAEGILADATDEAEVPTSGEAGAAAESPPGRRPPMRTLLKQFSEQFTVDFEPMIDPICQMADMLAEASADLTVRTVLPDLRDLLHHVRVLSEKVAGQQAYVLIFGPLKSGKSTFMNAICSAYVSEVTSLPAYPCIVNVTHDTTPSFTVTRYDGRSETYTARGSVYDVVQQAHSDLMATIRHIEDDGQEFDPAVHMPQAIRKIDVRLSTGDLAESGAVLVDTPGLYSRMKFGYDRLTRDFRNAAACAIFIVKTDNLFLEQVFAEFHELLDLFSRVFLIVNLDTTKQDLTPTGQLVPSLEHDDPGRIIDAFTDLSMSTPLKAAADAGRLQIYPVDLLAAASRRIQDPQDDAADVDRAHGQENFGVLLTDLTDYLNSSEYLRAFLNDSLRRAASLLDELACLTRHETVSELTEEAESLRRQRQETIAQSQAVKRLKAVDWTVQSTALHRFLIAQAQQESGEVRRITGHALVGAIDTWFDTDLSLAALRDEEIGPLLDACRKQFIHFLRSEMAQQMPGMRSAVAVAAEILADAEKVSIDIGALARAATEDATPAAALMPVSSNLTCEQVPVRRRFWDWLLMRSKASVRRRVFGPSANPDKPISPTAKVKRIGEIGQMRMQELTADQFEVLLADAATRLPEQLVTSYVANLTGPLAQAVRDRDEQTAARLTDIEARLAEAERILAEIASLGGHVEQTAAAIEVLKGRFGTPEEVAQDAPAGDEDEPQQEAVDQADDEFDELYAPYVAEASALPDQAGGDVQADDDEWAEPETTDAESEAEGFPEPQAEGFPDDETSAPTYWPAEDADAGQQADEPDYLDHPYVAEAMETPPPIDEPYAPVDESDEELPVTYDAPVDEDEPEPIETEADQASLEQTWQSAPSGPEDTPDPADEFDTAVGFEPPDPDDEPADDQSDEADPLDGI